MAFSELQILDQREIAEGFLEKVSINQEWDLKPRRIKQIAQKISNLTINEAEKTTSIEKRR